MLNNMLKHGVELRSELALVLVCVCAFVCQYVGHVSFVFAVCNPSPLGRFVL